MMIRVKRSKIVKEMHSIVPVITSIIKFSLAGGTATNNIKRSTVEYHWMEEDIRRGTHARR